MTETELTATVAEIAADGPLRARGIHLHVGSQLGAVDAWRDAVRRGLALLALIGAGRDGFDTFDVGGGFPVGDPGTVPTPARFGREVQPLLDALPPDRRPARLAVEPGRFLVARRRAGSWRACSTSASGPTRSAVVVLDAGMTELIRPALYGATHPIVALTSLGRPLDDAGRSGGEAIPRRPPASTARSARAPTPSTATTCRRSAAATSSRSREAGAYAASMAMAYNGRPAPAQVLLEADGTLDASAGVAGGPSSLIGRDRLGLPR